MRSRICNRDAKLNELEELLEIFFDRRKKKEALRGNEKIQFDGI
jgi:hypothetical protein